jgi:hypothetical protein
MDHNLYVMMSDFYISKSKILLGIQCPKRLFLEIHHPELAEEPGHLNLKFSMGLQAGEAARKLYPNGKMIENNDDLSLALEETRYLIYNFPNLPLFEASFEHNGILIRTDIIENTEQGCRVVEVKSSTAFKDYYLLDCAVQFWVINKAGYPIEQIEIAYVNRDFVYHGNEEYQDLFIYEDVTEAVIPIQDQIPAWLDKFQGLLKGDMPKIKVGDHCHKPFECPFFDHCFPELPEYPVTILPRGGKMIIDLMSEGIADIRDIPEDRLKKPVHKRIQRVTISGEPELDPEMSEHLSNLPYPRYYLDFETIQFAVPVWTGTRPYQQLPFQWSCHIEEKPGRLRHSEFLDTGGNPPMRSFAESLINNLGSDGPIFVYSAFEKNNLKQLAAMFPDIAQRIYSIIDRLVDLLPLVQRHYYHPQMKGSWSIKAVLPTIAPELDYKNLEEIQDGTGAQIAYLEAISPATSKERRIKLAHRMLEYCKMDTLALVKLVWFFQGKKEQKNAPFRNEY